MRHTPLRNTLALLVAGATALVALATPGAQAAKAATPDGYVALGDSYSSGNGANSTNLDFFCNRNTYAYPYLVAQQRPNTALTFVACGGATTTDVNNNQISALASTTKFVTITIGGNDIGFVNLLTSCWAYNDDAQCQAAADTANGKIANQLGAALDGTYARIKAASPTATVVVLGYPNPLGTNLSCLAADGISTANRTSINSVVTNLESKISNRVAAAGFTYKSAISPFGGHDICASDPWVNGKAWNLADAYHPSRSGYANGYTPLVRAVIG
ncbi:GDSL family lipase [Nocardioides sp. CF8]|jgi:lysophospholipase L1-like esterase|uniref:SGNH/GDSL hydrolase family protein n=1 Tax=Nocardioides sp. CF8 TaxID=110319 RepID=UPI00032E9E27|nr:SGNH/GDSL hydrolase family protein [Nocardioides sp. CF8]EON24106.1 GDSL family lipase [Nocardioides sp. CF8]